MFARPPAGGTRPRRVPPMNVSPRRAAPALVAALALALGCLAPQARDAGGAAPRAGLDRYRLATGEARSSGGCRYAYRVYAPLAAAEAGAGSPGSVTVLLGHGFLRDQDTLVGLARALANAGFRVVTLDFCNMRPWNGHHARNARDLVALAARVGAADVVYAGFSAGALAALLAAADDPRARGVVTLDLVDQGGLGADALARLDAPLIGLQGPPSRCNADGGGGRVFARRPAAPLETLPGASHCEFESPSDGLCELLCGDEDASGADARERADVVRRTVAAVRRLAAGGPGARQRPK